MKYSVEDLIQIMNDLRDKCPWDKKQTLDSLKTLTIEEAYELIEAIDKEDYKESKVCFLSHGHFSLKSFII